MRIRHPLFVSAALFAATTLILVLGITSVRRAAAPVNAPKETRDTSDPEALSAQLTGVAFFNGGDHDTAALIHQVLTDGNVQCYIEGSLWWGVQVHKDRLAAARELLQTTPKLRGKQIRVRQVDGSWKLLE